MSDRRLILQPDAVADLEEHHAFIARDNPSAAGRFVEASRRTLEELLDYPEIGRKRDFRNPRLGKVRQWRVRGFERYLIFYLSTQKEVVILRVFHGMRDIEALFDETQ